MPDRPRNKQEFVIRFGCAFIFFGCLVGILAIRLLGTFGVAATIGAGLVCTIGISYYVARNGDEAWEKILRK